MTAALKTDRSFKGPFLLALVRVRYHCPLYLRLLLWSEFACMVFLSQVHPTLCTFILTIRLRVVIHDKLDL